MKLLNLQKVLGDGRTMYFHDIHSVYIPPDASTITVTVGSWTQDPTSSGAMSPEAKTDVTLGVGIPLEYMIPNLLETISTLPEWRGGTITET